MITIGPTGARHERHAGQRATKEHGPAGSGRSRAAGRRRAWLLPGRRLPGAARGRHRAGLDHRHLDRRHQCEPHRGQCAGASAGAPEGILEADGAEPGLELAHRVSRLQREARLLVDRDPGHSRVFPAQPAGACRGVLSARRRSRRFLFDRAAGEDAERAGRFRPRQSLRAAPDGRSGPMSAPAKCAISTAATAN
ncbi:hypothetical protein ACVIWV_005067 [Bradyrhizobium diazoefficiens]